MEDSIHERGRAMEDLFFQQKDQQLLEKLRQELAVKENREALETATGIHDKQVLDVLLHHQINPQTLLAVGMIPLVAVAWADNVLHESEKKCVLKAASESGIAEGTASHEVLVSWLAQKPDRELIKAWEAYIRGLKQKLDASAFQNLKLQVMNRVERVADAAGGFLGLGNRISKAERAIMDEFERTFDE